MEQPEWLPALVLLESYGGNWARYEEALYEFYLDDFVRQDVYYRGNKIALKRHPELKGKAATFWHIISEGSVETERLPDMRRCERIRWPKPLIENCDEPVVKIWLEERNNEPRIHIWLEDRDYIVVLAVRRGYYLLWTAFHIEQTHQRRKFQKRYMDANKKS